MKSKQFPGAVTSLTRLDSRSVLVGCDNGDIFQVFISPTFYAQIFCTKVSCAVFLYLNLASFGARKIEEFHQYFIKSCTKVLITIFLYLKLVIVFISA